MDTEYTAENYMVNANEYELVYFMDANDNEIMAYAINNTDTANGSKRLPDRWRFCG
mgnify:CR=1 FL=1